MIDYNPLQLAYLGDAVYEVYVREYLIDKHIRVNDLQNAAIEYVSAKGQAVILESIKDKLTDSELDIIRRGRNAKSHRAPKNTNISTYKYSTGFEALIGYLHLTDKERLKEVISYIIRR